MALKLIYQLFAKLLSWMVLCTRSDTTNEMEILVLRHQLLIAGAGVVVLLGRRWGDTAAIVLASLSMIVNFLMIPFYPIWSLAIIALNVTVIWALTTRSRNVT